MISAYKKDNPVVDSKSQLIEWFESGVKSVENWRIGTEHEKFAYHLKDYSPLPYKGSPGIQDLLVGMQRFG